MFTKEQLKRYSRQLTLPEIGTLGQEKLMNSSVLAVGAGGLGSNVIMHLAAAGVGRIGIVDYDTVEPSNLNRQIIHSARALGENKAINASRWVNEYNPNVSVDVITDRLTAQNIAPIIAKYDFIVDCTDNFKTKFLINDACVSARKPFCHGGVSGLKGQVMTIVPGKACLRCVLGEVTNDVGPVLGSVVGVIGSIQANEAIKYLVGFGESGGMLYAFDGKTTEIRAIKLKKDPACPVCGKK